jgi:hypothetical protein
MRMTKKVVMTVTNMILKQVILIKVMSRTKVKLVKFKEIKKGYLRSPA